ncbi:histidine kinase/DNA gyrase B/HSP90-like ATPase [Actinophytocola oryzae]|uniref:histidine kinase n=1 Tax=Actinophytocola oryzae TaxID=502181 RepID=A0A4R7V7E9_9PSEU|nr:histidine kinase/DNA gyrase B/HSP90-like ATPase [Actinophytocola oryzae]
MTWLGPEPDPRVLTSVIGSAAGATGCALTVAGERFQWGDGDAWVSFQVTYDGEAQGTLDLAPASVGPMPEVVAVLGAPLALVRLRIETEQLRRAGDSAARQLVDDRWRAAAEMEQERRGLERDLHDGAQHHLVALRMAFAIAEHSGGSVDDLLSRLDTAERVLVDTAAGVLPVALVSQGLAAALKAELANHDDVALDIDGLRRRYPAVVESAVYFVCMEAVNNAHKHASGAHITVSARDSYRGLEFAVTDDGPGFVVSATGSGLHNLTERAGAVGGTVEVSSTPGEGTTVQGFVPL